MNEIRPQPQTLQVVSHKIRKPFTMVLDSVDDHQLSTGAKDTYRKLTSLIRLCKGECSWTERRIVSHLGMRRTTYQYHRRALEAVGLIEVVRRKKTGCRFNDANLLRLSRGASEIRCLKTTELNTNTTTPEVNGEHGETGANKSRKQGDAGNGEVSGERGSSGSGYANIGKAKLSRRGGTTSRDNKGEKTAGSNVSYHRIKWEHNRFRNHPPAVRDLYERNGALMAENRLLRERRVYVGASVGTWDDETKRLLREQETRYAEWDQELRERGGVR